MFLSKEDEVGFGPPIVTSSDRGTIHAIQVETQMQASTIPGNRCLQIFRITAGSEISAPFQIIMNPLIHIPRAWLVDHQTSRSAETDD
jgi:hypothetical protein